MNVLDGLWNNATKTINNFDYIGTAARTVGQSLMQGVTNNNTNKSKSLGNAFKDTVSNNAGSKKSKAEEKGAFSETFKADTIKNGKKTVKKEGGFFKSFATSLGKGFIGIVKTIGKVLTNNVINFGLNFLPGGKIVQGIAGGFISSFMNRPKAPKTLSADKNIKENKINTKNAKENKMNTKNANTVKGKEAADEFTKQIAQKLTEPNKTLEKTNGTVKTLNSLITADNKDKNNSKVTTTTTKKPETKTQTLSEFLAESRKNLANIQKDLGKTQTTSRTI